MTPSLIALLVGLVLVALIVNPGLLYTFCPRCARKLPVAKPEQHRATRGELRRQARQLGNAAAKQMGGHRRIRRQKARFMTRLYFRILREKQNQAQNPPSAS